MSTQQSSYLNITNRSEIDIKGVKDILSYESDKILFRTEDSNLLICGTNLNVRKFDIDNQCASITGHIDSVSYNSNVKTSGRFLASLFK